MSLFNHFLLVIYTPWRIFLCVLGIALVFGSGKRGGKSVQHQARNSGSRSPSNSEVHRSNDNPHSTQYQTHHTINLRYPSFFRCRQPKDCFLRLWVTLAFLGCGLCGPALQQLQSGRLHCMKQFAPSRKASEVLHGLSESFVHPYTGEEKQ